MKIYALLPFLLWAFAAFAQFSDTTSMESDKWFKAVGVTMSDNIGVIGTVQHKSFGGLALKASAAWDEKVVPFTNYTGEWKIFIYNFMYVSPLLLEHVYGGLGYTFVQVYDKGNYYIASHYWDSYHREVKSQLFFKAPQLDLGYQLGDEELRGRYGFRLNYVINPEEVNRSLPLHNTNRRFVNGLGRIFYKHPGHIVWGVYADVLLVL